MRYNPPMEITLSPEFESYVDELIAAGKYATKDEALTDGLRALRERQELSGAELEDLRREIQVGIDAIDRGEYEEFDETNIHKLAEDVHRRGMERLAAERLKRA